MLGHAYAAYLRVYQPLAAFPARERAEWAAYLESAETLPTALAVHREERRGLARALGLRIPPEREHALVIRHGRVAYLCPLRTELRTLQSLIAFHGTLPDEVADAFVAPDEVERAGRLLERLRRDQPASRSHIQQSSWHVPLHWFVAFDADERQLSPAAGNQPARLLYETPMPRARARMARGLGVLRELMEDAGLVDAVEELAEWLEGFDAGSLVQLDYGGLTRVLDLEELVNDTSAREVWEAIEALEQGDLERSGELYGTLTERWSALRARQTAN